MLCRTHPVKFYGQIFNVVLAFRNLGDSARLQRAQYINSILFNNIACSFDDPALHFIVGVNGTLT